MSLRSGGSLDNAALEARGDVLTFTTEPLETAVEVAGVPVVRLHVRSDNAHFDVFARLCDVSPGGRSANLTDQILRSSPSDMTAGAVWQVDMPLTDVSHVFLPGHRIRLQVSGGAHPRFARNLGTGADLVHGTQTVPVTHDVQHCELYPSSIVLPVVAASAEQPMLTAAGRGAAEPEPAP